MNAVQIPLISLNFYHDDVIKWKYFRVTGHLCGEFTGPQIDVSTYFIKTHEIHIHSGIHWFIQ